MANTERKNEYDFDRAYDNANDTAERNWSNGRKRFRQVLKRHLRCTGFHTEANALRCLGIYI